MFFGPVLIYEKPCTVFHCNCVTHNRISNDKCSDLSTSFYLLIFYIAASLMAVKKYLIVVLICSADSVLIPCACESAFHHYCTYLR